MTALCLEDITRKDGYQKRMQGTCGIVKPSIGVKVDFLENLAKSSFVFQFQKGLNLCITVRESLISET